MAMSNILEIKQADFYGMSAEDVKKYLIDNGYEYRDWYFEQVYTKSEFVDNLQFWKYSTEYVDYVQPCEVIGHNHGSINSPYDWIRLLSCLDKRHRSDTDVNSFLQMLKEQDNLSGDSLIHLEKYGDHYFFSEGRHRMVQAKFLEVDAVRCRVTEYVFDEHAYDLYSRIQSIATIISQENWKPDSPVSATVEGIPFIIPLEDKAVELLEQSIAKANSINRRQLCRSFYKILHGYRIDQCPCFNLKIPKSQEEIVSALVRSMASKSSKHI